jgi:transposase-like protein
MPRGKRVTTEQVIANLREIEIELSKGSSVETSCKKVGVTPQCYYRWRKEYGGLEISHAKRLKDLERENLRLRKLVADQALDNAMLKEIASGKF